MNWWIKLRPMICLAYPNFAENYHFPHPKHHVSWINPSVFLHWLTVLFHFWFFCEKFLGFQRLEVWVTYSPTQRIRFIEWSDLHFWYWKLLYQKQICCKKSRSHLPKVNLQGINISHLGKGKIIFKHHFWWDMLVPWRVTLPRTSLNYSTPKFAKRNGFFPIFPGVLLSGWVGWTISTRQGATRRTWHHNRNKNWMYTDTSYCCGMVLSWKS